MPEQEMRHNFLVALDFFPMRQAKFRTFSQYSVAASTGIVDEFPTAWQDGTCSPVDGDHGGVGVRANERHAL
jgi:hypothetical protein